MPATSNVHTYWLDRWFGLNPVAFRWSSILLHILGTWVLFAFGSWSTVSWPRALTTAAVWAAHAGHQEAVIWFAAIPEQYVFLFVMSGLLAWVHWVESRHIWLYAASFVCFVMALLSKESGIALVPLLALPLASNNRAGKRVLLGALPFVILAILYAVVNYLAKETHQHWNDGTFSLTAPFWKTVVISIGRLLWVWGFAAIVMLCMLRKRWPAWRTPIAVAVFWMTFTLLPYSFLTYMPHVPSRHTYVASVGLAFLVGSALITLRNYLPERRWIAALAGVAFILQNASYVWTYKHRQFVERSQPVIELLQFARAAPGTVYVKCYPYGLNGARWLVHMELGRPLESVGWLGDPTTCKDQPAEYFREEDARQPEALVRRSIN